jgi:PEGA domain
MKKLLLTCVTAAALLLPVVGQALPPIGPGPRGGFVGGPFFVGGFYGPFWAWGPLWGPYGLYDGYYYAPAIGTVKFDTSVKDAEVFVNGAYAGTVSKVKTLHLVPGTYNIELRAPDGARYTEKVYVQPGRTLHLHPDLRVQAQP